MFFLFCVRPASVGPDRRLNTTGSPPVGLGFGFVAAFRCGFDEAELWLNSFKFGGGVVVGNLGLTPVKLPHLQI